MRQQLYPNLCAAGSQDGAGDGAASNQLHTIDEDGEVSFSIVNKELRVLYNLRLLINN